MLKFCPKCGAKVLIAGAKFCMECGFNFGDLNKSTETNERPESASISDSSIMAPTVAEMEAELNACREYAENGYKLAQEKFDEMKKTLADEMEKLNHADDAQDQIERVENTKLIEEQKRRLATLAEQMDSIQADIDILHERQKDFSIVIYGRTMAGKSTLMEILTHGDGKSIGKGAQRTTLDVRDYYWNGLRITDVPGVCSFGGAEDDKLALEAARSADLILFLLTDDAPQAGEAECLAQLRNLGKPVLGVVNVKMAFDLQRRSLALRNLQKRLADTNRLDAVCRQFKNFAGNYSQDWGDIEFVYTHLNAAFQSQPGRGNDTEVFSASNFGRVEKFILDKVRSDGKFLRIKNFVDITAVPTCRIVAEMYAHAAKTLAESSIWYKKREELYAWKEKFIEQTTKRAENLQEHVIAQVRNRMDPFVDTYYESDKVGELWEEEIKSLNLHKQYNDFLQEIADECEKKRKELSDELTQELRFCFSGGANVDVDMGSTTPYGKWAWHIATNALMFVPGIGWAARIGIGIGGLVIGWLFDDKEDNIRKNKEKLYDALVEGTSPMIEQMQANLIKTINEEIIDKGIEGFADTLKIMQYTLAQLGTSQCKLAMGLYGKYRVLNIEMFQKSLEYVDSSAFISDIGAIARIPGKQFFLFAKKWHFDEQKVSSLLGEKIRIEDGTADITMDSMGGTNFHERLEAYISFLEENVLGTKMEYDLYPITDEVDEDGYYVDLMEIVFINEPVDNDKLIMTEQLFSVPIAEGDKI